LNSCNIVHPLQQNNTCHSGRRKRNGHFTDNSQTISLFWNAMWINTQKLKPESQYIFNITGEPTFQRLAMFWS
jgi:hypothetical protein